MQSNFTSITASDEGGAEGYAEYLTAQLGGGGGSRYTHYVGQGDTETIGDSMWLGSGADDLGLDGDVEAKDLTNVLNGWVKDGEQYVDVDRGRIHKVAAMRKEVKQLEGALRNRKFADEAERARMNRRLESVSTTLANYDSGDIEVRMGAIKPSDGNLGFDLTLSTPKGFGILLASSKADDVLRAHDKAVRKVVDVIESDLAQTRRGKGGVTREAVTGIAAAVIRHATSRPVDGVVDPSLHAHIVIPNRVKGLDGKWLTLDSQTLMKSKALLEAVYTAEITNSLTHDSDISFTAVETANAKHADVWFSDGQLQQEVLESFSRRAEEIAWYMEEARKEGKEVSAALAWAATREAKLEEPSITREMLLEWEDRFELHTGISLEDALVNNRERLDEFVAELTKENFQEAVRDGVAELADRHGVFRIDDLYRHINGEILPHFAGSVDADEMREVVAEVLRLELTAEEELSEITTDDRTVVQTAYGFDGGPASWVSSEFTTKRQIEKEAHALGELRELIAAEFEAGLSDDAIVEAIQRFEARKDFELTDAQLDLIIAALSPKTSAVVAHAAAGAGKSTVVAAAGASYLAATDHNVLVLSTARKASGDLAGDLREEAKALGVDIERITSTSLYGATMKTDDFVGQIHNLEAGTMIIIDEVGMSSTTHLDEVFEAAKEAGCKVVALGDTAQLSSPGAAGGLLRRAVDEGLSAVDDSFTIRNRSEEVRALQTDMRAAILANDAAAMDAVAAQYEQRGEIVEKGRGDVLDEVLADAKAVIDAAVLEYDKSRTLREEALDELGGLQELCGRLGVRDAEELYEAIQDKDRWVARKTSEAAMQRGMSPKAAARDAERAAKDFRREFGNWRSEVTDEQEEMLNQWMDNHQEARNIDADLRILTASRASAADLAVEIREMAVKRGLVTTEEGKVGSIRYGGRDLDISVGERVMVQKNGFSAEAEARLLELTNAEEARFEAAQETYVAQVEARIEARTAAVSKNMAAEGYSEADIEKACEQLRDSMAPQRREFSLSAAMAKNPALVEALEAKKASKLTNGEVWGVHEVREDGTLVLRGNEGNLVAVGREQLDEEMLSPAVASTIHKSQGMSVEQTRLVVLNEDKKHLTAESLYVAATRHKAEDGLKVLIDDGSDPMLEQRGKEQEAADDTQEEVEQPNTFRELLGKVAADRLAIDRDQRGVGAVKLEAVQPLTRDYAAAERILNLRDEEATAEAIEELARKMAAERIRQQNEEARKQLAASQEQGITLKMRLR